MHLLGRPVDLRLRDLEEVHLLVDTAGILLFFHGRSSLFPPPRRRRTMMKKKINREAIHSNYRTNR
jgi:uncharacterized protein